MIEICADLCNLWQTMIYLTSGEEDTGGRGAQTDAVLQPRQAEARAAHHRQQAQQGTETGNGSQQHRHGRGLVMVKEKNGLGLARRVLVTGFEGMRVHHDDPVHHMRVGEQRHSSPIRQKQQGKEILQNVAQLLQRTSVYGWFEGAKIRVFRRIHKLSKYLFIGIRGITDNLMPYMFFELHQQIFCMNPNASRIQY